MSQYGDKLKQLRQQMERKEYLNSLLEQLNDEKSLLEYQLEPLEKELDKALKKVERLEKGGLFGVFGSRSDKLDATQLELSAARVAYNNAKNHIDRLKSDIQKAFNESSSLSDAKRQYENLMAEIDTALAQGKTDIISRQELEEEQNALIQRQRKELTNAIETGQRLLEYLENIISGGLLNIDPKDIKKEIYKFRLAVNNVDISNKITVDFSSYRHFYSKLRYPGSYYAHPGGDMPVSKVDIPLSAKEMLTEVEVTARNVAETVETLKQQLEELT